MEEITVPAGSAVEEPGPARPLAVSVDEAGRLLGVSRDLVYDMVARRELAAVRLGRRIVVPVRALEAVLDVGDRVGAPTR